MPIRNSGLTPRSSLAGSDDGEAIARKVIARLVPFVFLLYFVNQLDRVNVAFASLTMNKDLGLSPEMYGLGAGVFFIGYFLFETPSNLIMHRIGARLCMFRIMLVWGIVSTATAFIVGPKTFYVARFLLGLAEAGFTPGMFLYLSYWVPNKHIGRATALLMLPASLTTVVAGPLSGALLELDGLLGMHGWQWMFIIEGLPALLLAFITLKTLPNRPADATWLTAAEKQSLTQALEEQQQATTSVGGHSSLRGLASPVVLLLSLIYVCMVVGLYGIAFWLPQIVRSFGFSPLQTGFIVAVPYSLGAMACVAWTRRSDRVGERRWHYALACFLAAAGLLGSAVLGGQWWALVPVSLAVIGIYAALPVFWCIPGRYLAGVAAAAGMAVINSVGNLGGFAGPYLVGWMRGGSSDFTTALVALSAGPFLAGLLVLCLRTQAFKDEARPVKPWQAAEGGGASQALRNG